jgi:hypothetical protein
MTVPSASTTCGIVVVADIGGGDGGVFGKKTLFPSECRSGVG